MGKDAALLSLELNHAWIASEKKVHCEKSWLTPFKPPKYSLFVNCDHWSVYCIEFAVPWWAGVVHPSFTFGVVCYLISFRDVVVFFCLNVIFIELKWDHALGVRSIGSKVRAWLNDSRSTFSSVLSVENKRGFFFVTNVTWFFFFFRDRFRIEISDTAES